MRTYIALFRGINVGGKAVLPMRELVRLLEELGLCNVKTYIQSGNAVFQGRIASESKLAVRIGVAIKEAHGFEPHVCILSSDEMAKAMASNPFPEVETDPKTVHVYFLASAPRRPDLKSLERVKRDKERFHLDGSLFYLHAPDGIGRSKLAARVEKALGVAATARNWRTVCKISAMARQCE